MTTTSYMFRGPEWFNSDVSKWDVSRVTTMSYMFAGATSFNGYVLKWDVSNVITTSNMFASVSLFNGDVSKWDVSAVTIMSAMFTSATAFNGGLSKWDVSKATVMSRWTTSFNGDVSKWDVSNVAKMDFMFWHATSFKHQLCESAWALSKASKAGMFEGSSGSISRAVCTGHKRPRPIAFSSKADLKNAVDACLKFSPKGYCSDGPEGPIGDWDVSSVTEMSHLFRDANNFNGDISKVKRNRQVCYACECNIISRRRLKMGRVKRDHHV